MNAANGIACGACAAMSALCSICALAAQSVPDPIHVGQTGTRWSSDYDVMSGVCDRRAITEAHAKPKAGAQRDHAVLTTAPADSKIAEAADDADRACLGHALELAPVEGRVAWTNDRGIGYRMIPLGTYSGNGRPCREFLTRVSAAGRDETVRHRACSPSDGVWQIVS